MNLRKQVEPLKKAALQASSLQRHAHHAASRLTWVKRWLKRAYRHHAQSRELERSRILMERTVRRKDRWTCEMAEAFTRRPLPGRAGAAAAPLCHEEAIEQA